MQLLSIFKFVYILTSTSISFYKPHAKAQQPSTSFDTPADTILTMDYIIDQNL